MGMRLEHMFEVVRLAQQHLAGVEKEHFLGDKLRQQAVMMNLVIIGEAAYEDSRRVSRVHSS